MNENSKFIQKTCVICGKEFKIRSSLKTFRTQKTCSPECSSKLDEAKRLRARRNYEYWQRKTKATRVKNCAYCGKKFTAQSETEIFCSADCGINAQLEIYGEKVEGLLF